MVRNKKPYQARVILKSIRYWKDVLLGYKETKRPKAYYTNMLNRYTAADIAYLEDLAKCKLVKIKNVWIIKRP